MISLCWIFIVSPCKGAQGAWFPLGSHMSSIWRVFRFAPYGYDNKNCRNIPVSIREAMQSVKFLRKTIPNLDFRELITIYLPGTSNYYSALETRGTRPLTPITNSPNFETLSPKHILSYMLFENPARCRSLLIRHTVMTRLSRNSKVSPWSPTRTCMLHPLHPHPFRLPRRPHPNFSSSCSQ